MGLFGQRRKTAPARQTDEDLFDEELQRRLEVLALVARKIYRGRQRAERRTRKTGAGIEFADHREYAPGDDFRYLDLNVYQRTGRLLIRLFEEEEDLSVYVIVDTSRSMEMGSPAKLDYAKRIAAALSYVALANLDRVSVLGFSDQMKSRLAPTRGKNRIFKVFEFLRPLEADGHTVVLVACILDRHQGGGERLAAEGYPFLAILEGDAEGNVTPGLR